MHLLPCSFCPSRSFRLLLFSGELKTCTKFFDVIAFAGRAWSWSSLWRKRQRLIESSQTQMSGRQVGNRPQTAKRPMSGLAHKMSKARSSFASLKQQGSDSEGNTSGSGGGAVTRNIREQLSSYWMQIIRELQWVSRVLTSTSWSFSHVFVLYCIGACFQLGTRNAR